MVKGLYSIMSHGLANGELDDFVNHCYFYKIVSEKTSDRADIGLNLTNFGEVVFYLLMSSQNG